VDSVEELRETVVWTLFFAVHEEIFPALLDLVDAYAEASVQAALGGDADP
jgi:hypothetical protein